MTITSRRHTSSSATKSTTTSLLTLSVDGRPHLIWMLATGTRGDIQPFVAAGSALVRNGYRVKFFTNRDFVEFANGVGLEGIAMRGSNHEVGHKDDPNDPFKSLIETNARSAHVTADVIRAELDKEKPDLAIASAMLSGIAWYLSLRHNIPHIDLTPVADIEMPKLPFDLQDYLFGFQVYKIFRPLIRALDPDIERVISPFTYCSMIRKPNRPVLVMQSPTVAKVQYSHLKSPYFHFVGTTVIEESEQTKSADVMIGDDSKTTQQMQDFLNHSKKPIYLGWGSMSSKSKEHLVELCVRSVHHSQQRAIVLCGDAGLSFEVLEQAIPHDRELLQYAKDNILFVRTAPHEWLFQKVSATVHHGGAGTTTAALRSGVPTIITPILADQFDHSRLVNKLGVGIGMKQQINALTWQDLSAAISRVLADQSMQEKSVELRQQLLTEPNGAEVIVKHVEEFWNHYWLTGKFHERFPPSGRTPLKVHLRRMLTGAVITTLVAISAICLCQNL